MKRASIHVLVVLLLLPVTGFADAGTGQDELRNPNETHLKNIKQLTFGGENAEAYFSPDGTKLIFQSTRPPYDCDQIFIMNTDGSEVRLLSTGKGRTTCSFLFPEQDRFLYASTHLGDEACPPEPDRSLGYVWPLYSSFDIFSANLDGSGLTRLTSTPGYDAEGAVSPDGEQIVFTSVRDGDLELYTMNTDGSGVKRLTEREGFDGGPFFSWDGKYIVYRSHYPGSNEEMKDYRDLIAKDLMRPVRAEIYVMNADGSKQRQITDDGWANWSPFMHPDSRRIIYSSNKHDPEKRTFSLYLVKTDGSSEERVTFGARFDSFPMFSRDGKKLVWCSTRNAKSRHEFNIFIADWQE